MLLTKKLQPITDTKHFLSNVLEIKDNLDFLAMIGEYKTAQTTKAFNSNNTRVQFFSKWNSLIWVVVFYYCNFDSSNESKYDADGSKKNRNGPKKIEPNVKVDPIC